MTSLILLLITLAALAVSYRKDPGRTKKALMIGLRSFTALIPSLLGLTALIGLVLAAIPPAFLADLFKLHGTLGFAVISMVGAVAAIPGPIAFPLAGSLLKLGANLGSLAAFVTTLTMVGMVTVPMEIEYFGKRFTVMREGLSFILAITIGGLMGVILR